MSNIQVEFESLKGSSDFKLKIINDIGEFKHVINITYLKFDVTITLQISECYPEVPPDIILRFKRDSLLYEEKLSSHLQSCLNMHKTNIVENLAFSANEWLNSNYQDVIQPTVHKSKKSLNKKQKKGIHSNDDTHKFNKMSMKTAIDVINRIIWDDLPTEDFSIGYLDRFIGIVEKQFKEFSWENIAAVDYDTLAIPKHRIQYFKFKDIVIWDKRYKIDYVFGSTGSGTTISDVIQNYSEMKLEIEFEQESKISSPSDPSDWVKSSCNEDSDDDVSIDIGSKGGVTQTYSTKDMYWGPKNKPTHFLALRITNPNVIESVNLIQDDILHIEPSYEKILMPTKRLHVTLACVGLDDYDQIQSFVKFLESIKDELSLKVRELYVRFKSIGIFFDRVLYAKVEKNELLLDFVEYLQLNIRSNGFEIRDVFDFNPHMTLLKLKSSMNRELKCPYLDGRLYNVFQDRECGEQLFDNIHLCEMSETTDFEGFYITPHKILF